MIAPRRLHRSLLAGCSLIVLILTSIFTALPAAAAPVLTVSPITWNVIGLDSNNVNVGPNVFPIGARVCNTGTDPATNITSSFVWDSTPSPNFIALRPGSLSSFTGADALPNLAAGACHDFYYEVEITRDPAAYDTSRRYHITASADGLGTISTPTPRELYVEHLVSQNRNATNDVILDGVSIPTGGTMALYVGSTYTIELLANTATNGYEQIETYINLPNTIFQVNAVSTTYTADGGTDSAAASKLYADGCSWENDLNSLNYRSCLSTGKYGGEVSVTYNVTIIAGGGTNQTLNTLIYDFSGSSYHYNSDFDVSARIAAIIDPTLVTLDKSFAPNPTNAGGVSTLTFTLSNPNSVPISGVSFSDTFPDLVAGAPGDMVVASPAVYSTSNCGAPTFAPLAGAGLVSFSDGTIPANGTCSVSVQVTVPTAGTYDNVSGHLFIDSIDTGDSASDSLTANTSPPPPDPICDLVMAQWTVPSTATDPPDSTGVPSVLAADVLTALASAGAGISANTEIATNQGHNDNYSWRANGGFEPGAFSTSNNDYFQFRVDTSSYEQVNLSFWAWRTQNGPRDLYIYFDTVGSPPGTLKTSFTGAAGLDSARTWKTFTIDFTGDTSTDPTDPDTYFYIFGGNSNNNNPGSDMLLDVIAITGCQVPDPPTITKSFDPDPVAVGDISTLTFTLTNPNLATLTGVSFDDNLPPGLEVASSPNASTTCGGTPTWAPSTGDTTLTFGTPSGASIPAGGTCTVQVDLTATSSGPHTNVSGFITSAETGPNTGPDGSASDTLTALAPPVITKQFSPNPIRVNETSTLTFTISNPNLDDSLTGVTFDDNLPGGVVVAASPNPSTNGCGSPTFNPSGGDTTLTFSGGIIPAGGVCSVQVDLTSASNGSYVNTSDEVSADLTGSGNSASDTLTVEPVRPSISLLKQVSTSSGGPWTNFAAVSTGDDVYYKFTVENTGDVAFSPVTVSDPDVDTGSCTWPDPLPVAVAANDDHIATCIVGPVSALSGSHSNTATASSVYSGSVYTNTSTASYATTALTLEKTAAESYSFAVDDVLHYSYLVTNTGSAPLAGPVSISDDLATDESCPALTTVGDFDTFLDPGESLTCTASYTVSASDVSAGSVTNTATAEVDGAASNPDSATVPIAAPSIQVVKEVSVDEGGSWEDADSAPGPTMAPGSNPRFRFTVTNDGAYTLSSITLSDSDTSNFFEGDLSTTCSIPGSLTPDESFACYGTIPWAEGQHSDTANTSGDFGGNTYSDSDDAYYMGVSPPGISKSFDPDPIAIGGTSTLSFTISNPNASTSLTGVGFSDSLPTGLEVAPSPNASAADCGSPTWAPSVGETSLTLSGATVEPGVDCIVEVDITATSSGLKSNTSGAVTSTNAGSGNTASADLTVLNPPSIVKTFAPDPIEAGETSSLTFTLTNPNSGVDLTGVAFDDTLPDSPAAMLVASPPNATTTCGGSVSASAGAGSISFSGGTINAGTSCTVTVDVTAPVEGTYNNTSGPVSSTNGGEGNTASDSLQVGAASVIDPALTKRGDPPSAQIGDSVVFTLEVFNEGEADATDVVVVDVLPPFLDIISVDVSAGSPTIDIDDPTNTVTITFATVGPDDVFTISINTIVNSLGLPPGGANTASLTSESADADPGNNSGAAAIRIVRGVSGIAPETGFAPYRLTPLPPQPNPLNLKAFSHLALEIPALGLNTSIVGVPLGEQGWDVTWLWHQVGYLEGTAFPGWSGNSVLTSHVFLPSGLPGPFSRLSELTWGDRVVVAAFGERYIYEVRESGLHRPDDEAIFRHEENAWLTLVTCEDYDEQEDAYRWRRVVRAVLIEILPAQE